MARPMDRQLTAWCIQQCFDEPSDGDDGFMIALQSLTSWPLKDEFSDSLDITVESSRVVCRGCSGLCIASTANQEDFVTRRRSEASIAGLVVSMDELVIATRRFSTYGKHRVVEPTAMILGVSSKFLHPTTTVYTAG
ncbi:hypothetical protein LEN26_016461 [Aphanomyces euteiches]|nr:hypothetical protein LEN26_016461 [Aphanomyces euteiches]KAH9189534.1 hypothetical protein AeNC1_008489 [Aphanomyces euteiches]